MEHAKISPSESWRLDMFEILRLMNLSDEEPQDLSLMLNFKRKKNGATDEFLGMNREQVE